MVGAKANPNLSSIARFQRARTRWKRVILGLVNPDLPVSQRRNATTRLRVTPHALACTFYFLIHAWSETMHENGREPDSSVNP